MNLKRLFTILMFTLSSIAPCRAADEKNDPSPGVDTHAIAILNRAVDRLAAAKHFSVSTEIWGDTELEGGGRTQFTKLVDVKVHRPNRIQMDVKTSVPKRSFYYDGKNLTMLDRQKGFYGTIAAPATIDETLVKVEEDYGVEFPLEDILISRPFGDGAAKAKGAQYLGLEPVLGVACHHLAFQSEVIDWQAWVEDGPVALVRKVVITSKEEEGSPQVTAIFSKWDFSTELPDFVFAFDPPPGSARIDFVPTRGNAVDARPSK